MIIADLSSLAAFAAALTIHADAPATLVRLNPPIGAPMMLTISDDRVVASDGTRATFVIRHHLTFDRLDGGVWLATIEQHSVACTGPERVCRAFEAALAPMTGQRRRFAVQADGHLTPLSDTDLSVDGAAGQPGANIGIVLAELERANPGAVVAAELTEALRFVGTSVPGTGDSGHNPLTVSETTALPTAAAGRAMVRTSEAMIDPHTGLVIESRVETRLAEAPAGTANIGLRLWTLQPLATAQ